MFREGQNHAFLFFFIVYKHLLNLPNKLRIKGQMQEKGTLIPAFVFKMQAAE